MINAGAVLELHNNFFKSLHKSEEKKYSYLNMEKALTPKGVKTQQSSIKFSKHLSSRNKN
jgi:hypothetical protein